MIGGALIQWLWKTTRVQEVVGSNLITEFWMVIFPIDSCKIVLFERPNINQKEAGDVPF